MFRHKHHQPFHRLDKKHPSCGTATVKPINIQCSSTQAVTTYTNIWTFSLHHSTNIWELRDQAIKAVNCWSGVYFSSFNYPLSPALPIVNNFIPPPHPNFKYCSLPTLSNTKSVKTDSDLGGGVNLLRFSVFSSFSY